MSEPDPRPEPSDVTESQLRVLDRSRHHRRTWELELLISGAVIFAFLGVPGLLEDWFFRLEVHASRDQFLVLFFSYYYLKLVAYILILSFCVNLTMRAYWVGLVGLQKVFPDGVRWRESKDGPISQRISRELPDLDKLIASADRISSLVFSTSFIAVILFLYSIVLIGLLSLVAWGISAAAFDGEHLRDILYTLIAVILVPPMVCGLLDKLLLKKPREDWEGRWYARWIHRVLLAFNWLSMRPLYAAIQMTLATNISRRYTIPVALLAFFGVVGFFLLGHVWKTSERLAIDGYRLFPDVAVERGIDHRHYESLQPHDEIVRRAPTIQSDIIEDPFVRLFIPYSPFAHDRELAKHCPDVEPIPAQEIKATARFTRRPPDESVDAALDCLGSFHQVYLNDEKLDLDYDFFTRGSTGVRGIVAYLPTGGLPKGRNALRIEQVKIVEENEEKDEAEEEDEKRVVYFIPFWL